MFTKNDDVKTRKMNLQLFADGGTGDSGTDEGGQEGGGTRQPPSSNGGDSQGSQGNPGSKVFSADYVTSLREEAKSYRQELRSLKESLKNTLGIEPDGEFETKVKEFLQGKDGEVEKAKATAKNLLLISETKLLSTELSLVDDIDGILAEASRLEFLKDVKVNDDGTVEGLKEALESFVEKKPYFKRAGEENTPPRTPVPGGSPPRTGDNSQSDYAKGKALALSRWGKKES